MSALKKYHMDQVVEYAARLVGNLTDEFLTEEEFDLLARNFKFRDPSGGYWYFDVVSYRWYRFEDGEWYPSDQEPEDIEGPIDLLPEFEDELEDSTAYLEAIVEEVEREADSPQERLVHLVEAVKAAYDEGHLESDEVEDFLGYAYLMDEEAKFWTVGARSLRWHYYENGAWVVTDESPVMAMTIQHRLEAQVCEACGAKVEDGLACGECGEVVVPRLSEASKEVNTRLREFLDQGFGSMPEEPSERWEPPEVYLLIESDEGVHCVSCGSENPGGSRFCNQCGSAMGCPSCAATNPPGSRFCNQCGSELPG